MKYNDAKHFITETLLSWGLWSDRRVDLMLMIAAHESGGFKHNKQIGGGPARGPFQMERRTHDQVWLHSDTIGKRAKKYGITRKDADEMTDDHAYALWMAVHYVAMIDPKPIPTDIREQAAWCKKFWNAHGKATEQKYLSDLQRWRSAA